jgi:hypothetical protein
MLGHTAANGKKSSKFEDSDSRMSRPRYSPALFFLAIFHAPIKSEAFSAPISGGDRIHEQLCFRAVSELPQRLKSAAAAGAEATGGAARRALGVRAMAPRSPLHEARMFL